MPTAALSILSLLQYAPQAVNAINDLYQSIRHTFSPSDQVQIDAALKAAQDADWKATAAADDALEDASRR